VNYYTNLIQSKLHASILSYQLTLYINDDATCKEGSMQLMLSLAASHSPPSRLCTCAVRLAGWRGL